MYRTSSLLALSLALAAPAWAADEAVDAAAAGDAAAAEAGFDQEGAGSIVVTGTRDRYGVEETTTATRTPTPLNDVPQAVTIVTEAQIEDQGLRSLGDVLRYVPGATVGQGEGHRDQITLRGNNSTADFFVDGLRDDVQYYRGLYNVERVEVLKGPNAMIFGRGGGGGVVNRILKRPAANAFQAGSFSIDDEGAWSADVDLNQPFGEGAALRLNGVYERFDSHRRFVDGKRYAVNPTGSVSIGGRTRIDLSYEYDRDERVVDRGVPSAFAGTRANPAPPLAGARDAFFGDPTVNELDFEAHVVRGRLEHRFSDSLSLTSRLLYGDYDKAYRNVFAATPVAAGKVGLEAYRDTTKRESLITQTDLVWETRTGGLGHVVVAGFEYSDQDSVLERTNGFFTGAGVSNGGRRITVDLANAAASRPTVFNIAGAGYRLTGTDAEVLAFYAQDQISFGDHFDLVAGLRFDRFRLGVTNLANGQRFERTDELWSPRLGLVAKPMENLSFYASYSRSYLPQSGDQFSSLDASTATLKPERFDNYEVGAKWDIRPQLSLTAALYRLDRTNTRATDPANPGGFLLSGEQRSKGFELGLTGEIVRNWKVSAGYTLQEAEVRSATTACPAANCEVPQVPRHTASLWNRYDVTSRIGLGLGVYHQSRSFASISNAVVIPSYTRVDAAAFFEIADGVEAQVNVENLFGEDYFATAHNDNNITPGAPTTVRGTVRLRF